MPELPTGTVTFLFTGIEGSTALWEQHRPRDSVLRPGGEYATIGVAMDEGTSFGYWIRRRRKVLDLTQAELAHQVGVATNTIHKVVPMTPDFTTILAGAILFALPVLGFVGWRFCDPHGRIQSVFAAQNYANPK